MSHRFSSADGLTPAILHQRASTDLRAAETLVKANASFADSAGYLAHRAIGLLFKAWLLQADGEFKDKYELHKLYSRVQEHANAPELSAIEIDALVKLGRFGGLPVKEEAVDEEEDDEAVDWTRVRSLFDTLAAKLPGTIRDAAA